MQEKERTYEAQKIKRILKYLERGELTHGLALFTDFKAMNKEINMRTDQLFGQILEREVAHNEEAALFLKRLKEGEKKLSIDLKQNKVDQKEREAIILKKAKDKIQYWKFEGEQLWQIASQAARKTIAIIDQVATQWKTLPVPTPRDQEYEGEEGKGQDPEVMTSFRSLAEKLDDSEQVCISSREKQTTAQEYLDLFKRALDYEKELKLELGSDKQGLCRRLQEALVVAFEKVYEERVEEQKESDPQFELIRSFTQNTLDDFRTFAMLRTGGAGGTAAEEAAKQDLEKRSETLKQILSQESKGGSRFLPNTEDLIGYFERALRELFTAPSETLNDLDELPEESRILFQLNANIKQSYNCMDGNVTEEELQFTPPSDYASINLDNSLYIAGGKLNDGTLVKTVTQFLAPGGGKSELIVQKASLKRGKIGLALASLKNDTLLFSIGGFNGKQELKDVEIYNVILNTWEWYSPLNQKRAKAGACGSGSLLYVFGGYHEKKGTLASSERFDYANPGKGWRKFQIQLDDWHPLLEPHAVFLHPSRVVVFGGRDSSDTFELLINEEGLLMSVELSDCSLDHPGNHAYKRVGGAIYAVNASGRLMRYGSGAEGRIGTGGENWLKIQ